ncbi:uncharacterized protein I303_106732 [Kwoniella dejecticola CBS 10117]|uniref:Uncharacterized protein n=1 Tax=Kwoniella dejecticola CBS 10117 TaxID=1296121 RepID=A0A1A5ZTY1_9TREE|nr:uncharacterized protein I303_08625 [Kwoniella dejecticola CBS 10117]OBR81240.1 hypothetical protein I303_08625 [Kwoniella dejecticola CBS 10117]
MIMISILAFSMFGMLVYVPATIGLTARMRVTKWDRAWGEVVYLGYQIGLWLANAIVAGIVGGPSYCSERLYESGKAGGSRKYSYEPITSIQTLCNGFSAQIALSSIHVAAMLLWVWWIYKTVTKLSLRKSASNPETSLWNVSVGELMRRDIRFDTRKYDEEGGAEGNHGVTPFITHIQSPGTSDQLQSESRDTTLRNGTVEPERDVGPYIPPPPYQNSYDNDNGNNNHPSTGISPTSDNNSHNHSLGHSSSPTNTSSTAPLNPNPNSNPSHSSYDHGLSLTDRDRTATSPSTYTHSPSEQYGSQRRTSLRRAMDEKEDSKDVIRRALLR